MPRVADFITIINDTPKTITVTEVDFPFDTGGRVGGDSIGAQGFVIFNVKGLKDRKVPVKVNGIHVGDLMPYPNTPQFQSTWFTQTIGFNGDKLRDGGNVLELEAYPGDNYQVKNVYCFFHQDA